MLRKEHEQESKWIYKSLENVSPPSKLLQPRNVTPQCRYTRLNNAKRDVLRGQRHLYDLNA